MEYRKDIISLYNSDEYQRLKAYYSKRSTLDILGVARNELAHSNMLAWLLDQNETHGLGLFPIRKFLQLLTKAKLELKANVAEGKAEFDRSLLDAILTNDYEVVSACVKAEMPVDSTGDKHKDGRIDIYIEVAMKWPKDSADIKILPIVVENKVGSKEHDEQTKSYYNWCMEYVRNDRRYVAPLFVFLTPVRTLALNGDAYYHNKTIDCSCEKYIRINYQYIADFLIEQCLKQDISEDTHRILKDYLRSLTYTYINGDIKEGDSYMAISDAEKELLVKFWENNQNLLLAVLEAYFESSASTDEETRDFRKLKETMSKKDFTKYQIEGVENGPFNKGRMVLEVVKKFVRDCERENKDITFDELKRVFNRKEIKCGFKGVVVKVDERHMDPRGRKRYFDDSNDIIRLKDAEVCVCSNWGKDNIHEFIKLAKELGFTITPIQIR